MIGYVDADLAGDKVIRSSRTGFVIYLNQAPIYWFSKRQNRGECSTFGREFVAMKQCCEYVREMRYKLRMMGIPVIGCSFYMLIINLYCVTHVSLIQPWRKRTMLLHITSSRKGWLGKNGLQDTLKVKTMLLIHWLRLSQQVRDVIG